jgi:transcription elongation factor Elf1
VEFERLDIFHNPIVEMASSAIAAPSPALSAGSGAGAGAGSAMHSAASIPPASSRTSSAKSSHIEYNPVKDEEGRILYFLCPVCGIAKNKQNTMYYHVKKHLEEKDFKCGSCDKAFLNKQGLETHMAARHPATSTAKRDYECPFEDCTFSSTTKGNVRTHCMRKHFSEECSALLERDSDTGSVSCDACKDRFKSLPAFFYHAIRCIKVSHTDPRAPALDTLL